MIAGNQCKHMVDGLIAAGADDVYITEDERLKEFRLGPHRKVIADVIEKYKPQIVSFGATPSGRVLAPMVAYRLGCGLTADCTGLDIRDNTGKGTIAILLQTRPALGGNVMATICTINSPIQMATARPGVMKKMKPDPSRKGNIIEHRLALSESDIDFDIIRIELLMVS